jgi:hypothetical protein
MAKFHQGVGSNIKLKDQVHFLLENGTSSMFKGPGYMTFLFRLAGKLTKTD